MVSCRFHRKMCLDLTTFQPLKSEIKKIYVYGKLVFNIYFWK